ncbi:MAG: hypothetical protein VCA57_17150 [Pseudomonas sp.]|uniref:hypothetical protein n=1 Tax=Pseudomonas sp. TaxID=306 RepID=UPI003981BEDF
MESLKVSGSEQCPFEFNFDPATFKAGDWVSYRVPEEFSDMAFVGQLLEVGTDFVIISPNDPTDAERRMRGTRASRPVVTAKEALE